MSPVLNYINFIGSLVNGALNVILFSYIYDLKYYPEKAINLSQILSNSLPIESIIILFNIISSFYVGLYLQMILCFPVLINDLYL